MKYINFKRYKFSTVLKKIDTIKHNFLGFFKFINVRRYNFKRILRYLNFKGYSFYLIAKKINFKKYTYQPIYFLFSVILVGFFKFINVRRHNFRRILRHLDFKGHFFNLIPKKINFKKYTYLPIYFLFSVILVGLVYLIIPTFYKYDKSNLEKSLCKNKNIECLIKGKVSYNFFPTPRIKIKDLVINDFFEKKVYS